MKTVKVRIAVAVDRKGDWNAYGYHDSALRTPMPSDEDLMTSAAENVLSGEARYWLTADLPVPEPVEVAAEVEDAV